MKFVGLFFTALLALTSLGNGWISIQWDPIHLVLRNGVLTFLGVETPGVTMEGNPSAPIYDCDANTGYCKPR